MCATQLWMRNAQHHIIFEQTYWLILIGRSQNEGSVSIDLWMNMFTIIAIFLLGINHTIKGNYSYISIYDFFTQTQVFLHHCLQRWGNQKSWHFSFLHHKIIIYFMSDKLQLTVYSLHHNRWHARDFWPTRYVISGDEWVI